MGMDLGTAIAYIDLDSSKFVNGMRNVSSQLSTFNSSTATTSQKMTAMGNVAKSVGGSLTKVFTLPLAAAGAASLKVATDFEAGMSEVSAITGATGNDLKKLETQAKDLGATTKFSATDAAEGMKYFGMAGYKTDQIMSALPATLNLAAAGGTDLGVTCDIVSDAMTGLGMSANETGKFTDIMAATVTNANTNIELMGETLKYAGPVAGTLGINMADLSVAIGLMGNAGIKGSQAGTALRGGLTNLVKPTDDMASAMKKYGVQLVKNDDGSVNLMNTMKLMRSNLGDLDQATQAQALATIFGKEAMSGWAAVVNASDSDFDKLTQAIADSEGQAKSMAEIMQDNLKGSIDNMKSALEGAGIAIGDILIPMFRGLVDKITECLTWFNGLDEGTQRIIVAFGGAVAAIGPLLLKFGTILTLIPNMVAGWGILTGALAGFTLGIPLLVAGFVAIVAAIGSNTTALDFLVDKFGFVGEVIATICEVIWGTVQLTFGNICIIIETAAKLIYAVMTGKFSKLDDITREGWAKIENNTAKALSNMNADTTKALKLIETQSSAELDKITNVYDVALSKLPELTKHNVGQAATEFTNSLKGIDEEGITILKGTSDTMAIILEGISADMIGTEKGTDKMKANLESLAVAGGVSANDLQKEVDKAMKTINENMVTETDLMKQNATNAFNAFKTVGTSSVKEMAENVASEIKGMGEGSVADLTAMGATWSAILSGVKDDGSQSTAEMKNLITQNLSDMGITGSELVNQLRTESTNHMNQMADEADKATKKGADAVTKNTQDAKTKAVENAKGAKDGSKQELDKIPQDAQSAMSKAAQNMDQQSKAGKDAVSNNMKQTSKVVMDESGKIPKDVQSNMSKSVQSMKQAGSDIYNGMNTSFAKTASQGKKHFSDLFNGVTRSTSKMASEVISDWNRIRSALSGTITGNVQIKVHGVQAALNQINSVKNAAKTRSVSPSPFMNLMAMPQSFAMAMPQSFAMPIDTNMYAQAYDMVRSNDIASYVSSQIPNSINLNIDSNNGGKSKKNTDRNINVEVKIDKFENKTSDSPKEIAEQVVDQVIYKIKRERYALGGA
ncbi:phage tail tape measure protein, TP901 family, core region [[Clostridium] bifermentans ATCC 19299]|uniref:phage tail tape measure protein n=1 Tax=Paraclostridium bifermentans TaxID=1490 RepID=UPI00038D0E82|nr:phage tail tape measure protein [Paraclostridium bifermentans]EQK47112.1 phage tail tape measure protein, TP901 family, core region [[Clostridium] bifermentans ATCC 19299] [Paraclostridium bifermentans ATCC 19299]